MIECILANRMGAGWENVQEDDIRRMATDNRFPVDQADIERFLKSGGCIVHAFLNSGQFTCAHYVGQPALFTTGKLESKGIFQQTVTDLCPVPKKSRTLPGV